MARPKGSCKKVDLEKLRALSLIGCSYELIASELGISHDTLQRRYLPLVHESRGTGKVKVLGKAYQMAISGNVRLLELFLINWLGFSLRPETVINVTQNATPAVPTKEEMAVRLAAAREFLLQHPEAFENGSPNRFGPTNGDAQSLPKL